ncbi:hypothetical protein N1851_010652 [Merluccius polli]|uniref:Uncharacterized protein n=1 Tax=Merluccius polli TaxID=89951 RepID=A0AA47P657_MERPO|nr:hypothetical protein N1851_010652 [Merluccius polli]
MPFVPDECIAEMNSISLQRGTSSKQIKDINLDSVWYGNCSIADRKALQRVVKLPSLSPGPPLPTTEAVHSKRCLRRARSIAKDSSHPGHKLFTLLPSGRRYRSLRSRTSRFRNSFFPSAVTLLNSAQR